MPQRSKNNISDLLTAMSMNVSEKDERRRERVLERFSESCKANDARSMNYYFQIKSLICSIRPLLPLDCKFLFARG